MAPNEDSNRELAQAISGLTEIVRSMAPDAGLRSDPGPRALERRFRMAQSTKLMATFFAAIVLAALVIPGNKGGGDTVAAGGQTATGTGLTGGGGPLGGSTPGTEATGDTGVAATGTAVGVGAGGAVTPGGGAAAPGKVGAASTGGTATTVAGGGTATTANVRGVTDTEVKVGVVVLDSSDLAPVCPRCGNGPTKDGTVNEALVAAWKRDGLLPVHGRMLKFERRQTKVLDTGQRRAACVEMSQEVKPFVVLVDPMGTFDVAQCMAGEFKQLTIANDSPPERVLAQIPTLWAVVDTPEKTLRNFVRWAHELGLFKDKVLGLYQPNTPEADEAVNNGLKPALAQMGYQLAVTVKSDTEQGGGGIAVQRFRASGVTAALLMTDRLSFQQAAKSQGYKPTYPTFDIGSTNTYTDAVADISFDAEQMDGNVGMRTKYWDFAVRKPATPRGNPAAEYCLKAYQDYTKRPVDAYENNAEVQYAIEACTNMQVLLKALQLAGRDLTPASFQAAMAQVRDLPTAMNPAQTFTSTRRSGTAAQGTYQFKMNRTQPDGTAWHPVAPGWQRLWFD